MYLCPADWSSYRETQRTAWMCSGPLNTLFHSTYISTLN